jgi:hypothetical protein
MKEGETMNQLFVGIDAGSRDAASFASLNSIRGKKRPEYPSAPQLRLFRKNPAGFLRDCPPPGAATTSCIFFERTALWGGSSVSSMC